MVEIYKLPGTLTDLVSGIQWAELNAKGGDVSLYANQAIAAGGTITSTAIAMSSYHSGYLTIDNLGASTNLQVLIESSVTQEGTTKTPLMSAALNTTKKSAGAPVAALPNYVFVTVTNMDAVNASTFSITLSL